MSYAEEVKQLSLLEDNINCIDCSQKNTQWTSLSYGIFLCMECASIHRGMGVRISVVKSINLDKWTEEGLLRMKLGGNKQFKEYLKTNEILNIPITEKYKMDIVKEYKDNLQDKINQQMPHLKKTPIRTPRSTPRSLTHNTSYENHIHNQSTSYSSGYSTSSFSNSDLKSTVSSALYKISDFVAENASYLKEKSVEYGSKLNENILKPSTAYIKEKGRSFVTKSSTKKQDEYTRPGSIKNKKIDNPGKWD